MFMIRRASQDMCRCRRGSALLWNRESALSLVHVDFKERFADMFSGFRGLYIPNEERYPAHFRGMGIRIEDSICVEEEHPLVLTTKAIKEVRLRIVMLQD